MDALIRKRSTLKGKCTRLANNVDKLTSYDNLTIQIYAKQADELWTELLSIHDEIMCTCDEKCIPENESEFSVIADKIDALKINIAHMFKEEARPVAIETESCNIKLPRLDLPSFSGNFSDWISFRDIFISTVHNNTTLSNVQKLQYLKLSLKGEALTIIQNIQISDANYAKAWKIICERFENSVEIIYSTLDKLFSQPNLQIENAQGLRRMLDVTNQCLDILEVMSQPIENWDTILVYFLRKKLDSESLKEWHLSHKDRSLRSFAEFKVFLETRAAALASININKRGLPNESKSKAFSKSNNASSHLAFSHACFFCKGSHPIYKCDDFMKLSFNNKKDFIAKNNLCSNCLRMGHRVSDCVSSGCKICNLKHNTLLHINKNANVNGRTEPEVNPVRSTHCSQFGDSQILLPTAIVNVIDASGNHQKCRVLIDSASQSSFISENCVQKLKLNRKLVKLRISGVSGKETATTNGSVKVNLSSCYNKKFVPCELHILRKVTCNLPQFSVDTKTLDCFDSVKLADPNYNVSGSIDILLGADFCSDIFVGNCIKAPHGSIAAHETIFGWVIFGKATPCKFKQRVVTVHHSSCDRDINSSLQKFWQVEEIPNACRWTKEEIQCNKHFQETHSRNDTGRYVVNLPFKQDPKPLGESREMAIKRFKQIERKISRQPILMQSYSKFMSDYLTLGHMEMIPDHELNAAIESTYYIPHHCIKNESDLKFRVVFDASAKTTNDVSLNDNLLIGPTIQDDLFNLILRFRERKIALKADIAKMYRQVRVSPNDTNYQRILWRNSPHEPIRTYRLLTVTYGTAAAPYLATKCLQQLVHDEGHAFPLAAQAVIKDFYMDDLLSGMDTTEQAIQLQLEINALLKKGGFELRKWSSNEPQVLKNLSEDLLEINQYQVQSDNTIKTLGILWDPRRDVFLFKVSINCNNNYNSKRTVLSMLSQLFDPLGWLTPVTIAGKILIQMLWKEKLDWDEPLPSYLENVWNKFKNNLHDLELVKIPRYVSINGAVKYELHGFSDSSEKAYAAAIYLRSIDSNGNVQVHLIASKSKVAPLKNLTLPRLELCGAHLLAKLMSVLISGTNLSFDKTYCWCDSTIVLAWLDSPPNRWKTFIANRVAQINEFVPNATWHYVPSLENPADCASRGISPSELKTHNLWWNGPPFLTKFECISHEPTCTEDTEIEIKNEEKKISLMTQTNEEPKNFDLLQKYSSLSKLKRVTAYCFRFIKNCKLPVTERNLGFLTASELKHALMFWVKETQSESFHAELEALQKSKPLAAKSKILSLNPVLHDGVLKVGGRLRHANVPDSQKRPILLPKEHVLTKLILQHIHVSNLHAGAQLMQACLTQQFWVISARSAIRGIIANCVVCKRHRAQRLTQQMGDLPASRVNPSRPFTHCGVDYCGPFSVKISRSTRAKSSKAYLALFICFATKAVHLELVSDLTTDAFIAALKRFVSRRGKCAHMYSDCGSNFIGANRKLKAEITSLLRSYKHNEEVSHYLSENGIEWHFNPPSAPHMGGLWESNIKCVKQHLRKIVSNVTLTFEELYTIFTQIEACLNSRPIAPMSKEPSDLTALTPGHFIAGGPLTAIPETDHTTSQLNRLSRWELTQKIVQHFWNRWKKEYILQLQQRSKWRQSRDNLTSGDLVLIVDDNLPPMKWKLGRINSVHPGSDGKVRVVTVKTVDGIVSRAVTKLCKL